MLDLVTILTPHVLEQLVTLLANHEHSVPVPSADSPPGRSSNSYLSFCLSGNIASPSRRLMDLH